MSGFVDLHCHLLPGLDDGAKTLEDSLEMARALVDLGFSTVAPSPHARAEYPPASVAIERLAQVQAALNAAGVPIELAPNAENYLLEDGFVATLGTPRARTLGGGRYVLVEAPYQSPVPSLTEVLFRMKLKGVAPLIAHPERCFEFGKKGRAAEVVRAGALLQLDLGSLVGKYGSGAKKLARAFLDEGLYAVAATDLHGPKAARRWLGKALAQLRSRAGEEAFVSLIRDTPAKLLRGEALESRTD